VPYRLKNIPLNQQMQVYAAFLTGLKSPPAVPGFIPSPSYVTLTPASPSATGVDFEMIIAQGGVG